MIFVANKLSSAIDTLKTLDAKLPNLYCSRTINIDEKGNKIGISPLCKRASFRNALVQNMAGGNTMVFNSLSANALAE